MEEAPIILVVDDELSIITALQQVFKGEARRTAFAMGLKQGRAAWEKHFESIKVLIIDFSLPDGFGTDLATQALNQSENVKVIITSGRLLDSSSFPESFSSRIIFLQKPFSVGEVREMVEACLSVNSRPLNRKDKPSPKTLPANQ